MRNSWFKFKEFTIVQEHCGMKVSTDACIQGAWAASFVQSMLNVNDETKIQLLDIGTGTGLLSLMFAQAIANCHVDAIEADTAAAKEAAFNFAASKWGNYLKVHHTTLQAFESSNHYDVIICNPPFFHKHMQAPEDARNKARHDVGLSKDELAFHAFQLLKNNGLFCVMYPASEWESWIKTTASIRLNLVAQLNVVPTASKPLNRIIGFFSKEDTNIPLKETLHIRSADNKYTSAFEALMEPYYL